MSIRWGALAAITFLTVITSGFVGHLLTLMFAPAVSAPLAVVVGLLIGGTAATTSKALWLNGGDA